jgi:hypothetical protein
MKEQQHEHGQHDHRSSGVYLVSLSKTPTTTKNEMVRSRNERTTKSQSLDSYR